MSASTSDEHASATGAMRTHAVERHGKTAIDRTHLWKERAEERREKREKETEERREGEREKERERAA